MNIKNNMSIDSTPINITWLTTKPHKVGSLVLRDDGALGIVFGSQKYMCFIFINNHISNHFHWELTSLPTKYKKY